MLGRGKINDLALNSVTFAADHAVFQDFLCVFSVSLCVSSSFIRQINPASSE
jgi:hypothetical protein